MKNDQKKNVIHENTGAFLDTLKEPEMKNDQKKNVIHENTGAFLDTLKEPELELIKIEKTLNDDCIQRMDGFSPHFMAFEAVIEKHPVVHQDLETEQNDQYGS